MNLILTSWKKPFLSLSPTSLPFSSPTFGLTNSSEIGKKKAERNQ